jgi:hypothetical protein
LPKESAAYKRYLEKFDSQETELEKLHERIEKNQAEEKRLQDALTAHLKTLTVE